VGSIRSSALLIEEGWHSTMTLARALEDAGYAVTVLTANGTTARSRRRSVEWLSGPTIASDAFLAHVDDLVRARDVAHVLPLTEAAMLRLAAARVAWRERVFPQLDAWQQSLVRDKHVLIETLAERGIAIPRHVRIGPAIDLDQVIEELSMPLVVKGATGSAGKQVRIVESPGELGAAVARVRELGGEWIIQQHVASPTYLVGGLFHGGEPVRIYAGEKLELYPPRTGGAIRLRSRRDDALIDIGLRAMKLLRWTGFASADLVRDASGYLLLEVNPRLWGSLAGTAAAGVDLFGPFAELLDGRVPASDLAFSDGCDCLIFPRYLYARSHWNAAGIGRLIEDLRGPAGEDWRDGPFFLHILHRLYWLKRNGQKI